MQIFTMVSRDRVDRASGFTIIELLVVITIIVILLAILAPGLEKALASGAATQCAANESAVGKALGLYLLDHRRTYPIIGNYNGLFGNLGNTTTMSADHHGANDRPLNLYLGYDVQGESAADDTPVRVAECPSDQGDSALNLPSAYKAVGNSYYPQMARNNFRTRHVFGWDGHGHSPLDDVTGDPLPPDSGVSMTSNQISRADNKIILADWPWHGDRLLSDARTQWHDANERRFNTLFADGHVELFLFEREKIEVNGSTDPEDNWQTPPNRSFRWW